MNMKIVFALAALATLTHCASRPAITYDNAPPTPTAPSPATTTPSSSSEPPAESTPKSKPDHDAKKADKHATATHEKPSGIEPDKAQGWLKNGNLRFQKGNFRKDGARHADVVRLSTGQHPHTIIISCSDSRVPPEVVFDQKLGEIFVIRTAGETLDAMGIASIEYAVEHLNVRNLVVMGHTECGAIKAAVSTLGGMDAGSPNLNKLVADIHPRLKGVSAKTHSEHYKTESWANVKGVARDLLVRSHLIAEQVHNGNLKIRGALYDVASGVVDFE